MQWARVCADVFVIVMYGDGVTLICHHSWSPAASHHIPHHPNTTPHITHHVPHYTPRTTTHHTLHTTHHTTPLSNWNECSSLALWWRWCESFVLNCCCRTKKQEPHQFLLLSWQAACIWAFFGPNSFFKEHSLELASRSEILCRCMNVHEQYSTLHAVCVFGCLCARLCVCEWLFKSKTTDTVTLIRALRSFVMEMTPRRQRVHSTHVHLLSPVLSDRTDRHPYMRKQQNTLQKLLSHRPHSWKHR